jgi:formylglycine-generating enzyme required for sulfatase activity
MAEDFENTRNADTDTDMVFVQGGTFAMGNHSANNGSVTLSDYFIGKYPVTQRLWKQIMGAGGNPSKFKGDDLPVETVCWDDARKFIKRLNKQTGTKYRLPTEAQWEFAARGGNKSAGLQYSGSDNIDEVAWHNGNSGEKTHPVGAKAPNELGIYDMSGNVWEWVGDRGGEYTPKAKTNPRGPLWGGIFRVFRGGSWGADAACCRVSSRAGGTADDRGSALGFRLAHHI